MRKWTGFILILETTNPIYIKKVTMKIYANKTVKIACFEMEVRIKM